MRIMPTSDVGIKQIIINRLDELVFVKNLEKCLAPSECFISGWYKWSPPLTSLPPALGSLALMTANEMSLDL